MNRPEPLAIDRQFFDSLLAGNVETLASLLSEDFILIDVMRGGEVSKVQLLDVIKSGELVFEKIEPRDCRVRSCGTMALVTGCTSMQMRFGRERFSVGSRYTHVYIEQPDRWLLVAAQGTRIDPT